MHSEGRAGRWHPNRHRACVGGRWRGEIFLKWHTPRPEWVWGALWGTASDGRLGRGVVQGLTWTRLGGRWVVVVVVWWVVVVLESRGVK